MPYKTHTIESMMQESVQQDDYCVNARLSSGGWLECTYFPRQADWFFTLTTSRGRHIKVSKKDAENILKELQNKA